jgi:hypothetical protein
LTGNYELLEQGTFFARLAFFLVILAAFGLLAHLQPPESPLYCALCIVLITSRDLESQFQDGWIIN